MAEFYTILTEVGKAKVANAALLNKNINLTTMKIGDGSGSYYSPSEQQTDIVNQVYSTAISSIEVDKDNPNWIIVIGIIPGSIGGFYIREVGLFDDEGDMIAIGKYPETYKPSLDDGATNDLRVRTIFEVSNTENVTLKINPSVIFATKEDINNLQKQIDKNSSSLNAMANYFEQGTWIPRITVENQPNNLEYSIQKGTYTRIKNRVFVDFLLKIQTLDTSMDGYIDIVGLPYSPKESNLYVLPCIVTGYDSLVKYPIINAWSEEYDYIQMAIIKNDNSVATATASLLKENMVIRGQLSYEIEEE